MPRADKKYPIKLKIMNSRIAIFIILTFIFIACKNNKRSTNSGAESIFSTDSIETLSINNPEFALTLLDSAERNDIMSPFEICRLRFLTYHNGYSDYNKALRYGLQAIEMPEARIDAETYLYLVDLISNDLFENGDYAESVRMCTEGLKVAKDSAISRYEANLHLTLGQNLLAIGNDAEAYRNFDYAVSNLRKGSEQNPEFETNDDYIFALGVTVNSLSSADKYDKVVEMLPEFEKAISDLERCDGVPAEAIDQRKAGVYALFAYSFSQLGNANKASELYNKLCDTNAAGNPAFQQIKVPYLISSHHYAEALRILKEEKAYWRENADTISYDYINNHLKAELEAYRGLNDIRNANRILETVQALSDTLLRRERVEKTLELAEIYKSNQQAMQIERQQASINIRNYIIAFAVAVLLLSLAFIIRMTAYNRVIKSKNRSMTGTINELSGYKERTFELESELMRMQAPEKPDPTPQAENSNEPVQNMAKTKCNLTESDRILFDRMQHHILDKHLFLDPDFSRTELLKVFDISPNKFAHMFRTFAGCTFPQYLQNCRLDYAVKLMRENPNWTLNAIAMEINMSRSTFYSLFKEKYGLKPSEFRKFNSQ